MARVRNRAELRAELPTLTARQLVARRRAAGAGTRRLIDVEMRRREREVRLAVRCAVLLIREGELWRAGYRYVAGVDEAGVGPLAGPVVAAAVILPPGVSLLGVDDSKRLSARQRTRLAKEIRATAVAWAIGCASVEEIDALNILVASRRAMQRAVVALVTSPDHLLVDARVVPEVTVSQEALVHGDSRSLSIAAASILAKVHRDALLDELEQRYPGYGFARHRGYGTALHLAALRRLGPCPEHRRSFAPVAAAAHIRR